MASPPPTTPPDDVLPDEALPDDALVALDAAARGDDADVVRFEYGETSRALLWERDGAGYACERLPRFPDARAHEAYVLAFDRYQAALAARGVPLLPSLLRFLPDAGGGALWCVQPALGPGELLLYYCRAADADEAERVLAEVVALVARTVDASLGLDGRLSSWAVVGEDDGAVCYRALSVPRLRTGAPDPSAGFPSPLRPLVRRLAATVAGEHYSTRGVLTALGAGLVTERLPQLVPPLLALTKPHLSTPLTAREVHRAARARRVARTALQLLARLQSGRALGRAQTLRLPALLLLLASS